VQSGRAELAAQHGAQLGVEIVVDPAARRQPTVQTKGGQAMELGDAVVGSRNEVGIAQARGVLLRQLDQRRIAPARAVEQIAKTRGALSGPLIVP
jgi:hypothetical protein